jgi:hypothetical protein
MASREKDQADFDLERVMDMFDQALTSKDERVINALRSLLMIVALTAPESPNADIMDRRRGPFRQLQDDLNNLHRSVQRMDEELRDVRSIIRSGKSSTEYYPWDDNTRWNKSSSATSWPMPNPGDVYGPITMPIAPLTLNKADLDAILKQSSLFDQAGKTTKK